MSMPVTNAAKTGNDAPAPVGADARARRSVAALPALVARAGGVADGGSLSSARLVSVMSASCSGDACSVRRAPIGAFDAGAVGADDRAIGPARQLLQANCSAKYCSSTQTCPQSFASTSLRWLRW